MRPIKFRGKWVGDMVAGATADKWEYGCLAFGDGYYYILSPSSPGVGWFSKKRVSPETIGQYTGLNDKDDVEIYEGDILGGLLERHLSDVTDQEPDCGLIEIEVESAVNGEQ